MGCPSGSYDAKFGSELTSWLGTIVFFNTLRSERLSRDLDREFAFHLEERIDELVATGMSESEARRQARLRFGHPSLVKERTRDLDVIPWVESILSDLRYALRALRARPGFALVVVLSLGLGIGANTAIFSLIDAVMLRSLPVSQPEQLFQLTVGDGGPDEFTNPLWEALREEQAAFSGAFAFASRGFKWEQEGGTRSVEGAWVSGDVFRTLGVTPEVGRVLGPADDRRGCPAVAVLGHGFWRSAYGGDASAVGATITLDGHPFEIVGVADPTFFGVEVGRSVQVYSPLCAKAIVDGGDGGLDARDQWFLRIIGRRRDDLTTAEMRSQLAAAAPAVFAAAVPTHLDDARRRDYLRTTIGARPAAGGYSAVRSEFRDPLLLLMAVVGLVLLIACSNIVNLLLARAATRRREIGMRLALGASRGRIVRQLFTESLLLSLLSASAGVLFAIWASRFLVRMLSGTGAAIWLDLPVDGRLLAFALAMATGTALLFGVGPALRLTRLDAQTAKPGERGIVGDGSRPTRRNVLVPGQIALSLVLVVGAGLLLATFRNLVTLDPGFRREGVLLASADLLEAGHPEEEIPRIRRRILDEIRGLPGIQSASASAFTPISGTG